MLAACKRLSARHPILIMAAAVGDYKSEKVTRSKIASGKKRLSLNLTATPDLLKTLAPLRAGMRTIGFALETTGGRARAREKMKAKKCDMIVLNNPTRKGSEFGGGTNEVVFLYPDGREEALPVLPKSDVAREIIQRALEIAPSKKKSKRKGKK
jgi:phosphopantothenoylcysteine decarboxylase/phosphopantothenate--cysteine ligase